MPTPGASPPEALTVELYDAYLPALTAGTHRVVVQQTIAYQPPAGPAQAQAHHYYRDEAFLVSGPRFFIDENDIHARSPSHGAMGDFERHIPSIVLRKRALPWERELALGEGVAKESVAPWLALLLLTEAEFQAQGGEEAVRAIPPADLFVATRRSADGTVLFPRLEPEPGNDARDLRAQVMDLDRALVRRLCPTRDDLARLVHVRRAAMDDKPRAAMHGAGEFPVVSAGRIPAPGANIALLVSLEGWEELIEGAGASLPAGPDRLRLVILSRWRFTHDPAFAHSFPAVARDLTTDLLHVATPEGTPETPARMLAAGYTPMPYRPEAGGAVLAWYRGPFAPAPVAPLPLDAFTHADAALIVSPDDGAVTLSYAAAWQLGRLMALASPAFLAATRAFITEDAGPREVAFRLDTFMRTHLRATQREWAAADAASAAEPAAAGEEAAPPGYFQAALAMLGWLRGILLLQGIPFHYLVAGETLLPAGSLRFFHLDPNWVLALANGALSLSGTATGTAAAAGPSMRGLVSRILERCVAGAAAMPDPGEDYLDRPRTGFLLRSTLVADWPGLETHVATTPESARPVRLERLAGDLLLGIAEGQITSLTFREPPEGLAFRLAAPREGVPEPDEHRQFSPLARLRALSVLGLAPAVPDPLSAAAFAAISLSSGSSQSFVWESVR
ncbi:hypothetical protein [Ancylobacter sp.]|uniref:hypothetical protein n=1 Tax=Ancylobacter sp. TaxID=1872567 RepID=UPI003D0EAE88